MFTVPRWKTAVWLTAASLLFLAPLVDAQNGPDLSEFKTVDNAVTTKIRKSTVSQAGSPGYLGVLVSMDGGKLVISDVEDNSPAAKAGLRTGDVIVQVDGKAIKAPDAFRSAMQGHLAGDKVEITVQRGNEQVKLSPSLMATSRIMTPNQQRGAIGATAEETKDGVGIALKTVTATGPAEKAGLKVGDILLKLDGKALDLPSRLTELIADRKPGDMITLLVKNEEKDKDVEVTLSNEIAVGKGKGKGGFKGKGGGGTPDNSWDTRNLNTFKRDVYKLAIVGIEYSDVKHNEKVTGKNWEDALFSTGTYNEKSVTGEKVFCSMNDYYHEVS